MRAENENWGDTVRNHLFDQRSAVMVHWLILLNVVIFILGFFFQVDIPRNIYPPVHLDLIQLYGAYSEYTCFHEGELWRLLTYQFLHANLGHIMFNMIALWFFGPVVEERFGHWRFLLYYLFCGVAAALFSSLLGYMGFFDPEWRFIPMVGASGSIYGIMAACAVLFPHARVQLLFQWNNAGGEAGHLGGMFAGFILTLLILWKEKMSSPRRKAASSSHYSPEPSSRRPAQAYPSEKEVDEIMEKISRSGLSSLTEEEREILRRASRR